MSRWCEKAPLPGWICPRGELVNHPAAATFLMFAALGKRFAEDLLHTAKLFQPLAHEGEAFFDEILDLSTCCRLKELSHVQKGESRCLRGANEAEPLQVLL